MYINRNGGGRLSGLDTVVLVCVGGHSFRNHSDEKTLCVMAVLVGGVKDKVSDGQDDRGLEESG